VFETGEWSDELVSCNTVMPLQLYTGSLAGDVYIMKAAFLL